MSTLSQFAAGGIKSVQRGVVTPTSSNQNVTIPVPVNTAKAFLSTSVSNGIGFYAQTTLPVSALARITSSAIINIQVGAGGSASGVLPTVSWEVVEFY